MWCCASLTTGSKATSPLPRSVNNNKTINGKAEVDLCPLQLLLLVLLSATMPQTRRARAIPWVMTETNAACHPTPTPTSLPPLPVSVRTSHQRRTNQPPPPLLRPPRKPKVVEPFIYSFICSFIHFNVVSNITYNTNPKLSRMDSARHHMAHRARRGRIASIGLPQRTIQIDSEVRY